MIDHSLEALEEEGVPVKTVIYDGFGQAVMGENENWFGHSLWASRLLPR